MKSNLKTYNQNHTNHETQQRSRSVYIEDLINLIEKFFILLESETVKESKNIVRRVIKNSKGITGHSDIVTSFFIREFEKYFSERHQRPISNTLGSMVARVKEDIDFLILESSMYFFNKKTGNLEVTECKQ
ncbi:hypothetical protein CDIK_1234 [Cucumispora dikerogammari]|nr:hypothetical protein CDIK_1234 [Cucumispora dikerogammari]